MRKEKHRKQVSVASHCEDRSMQTNSVQGVVEFLYLAMRDKFNWMLSATCVSEEVLGCRACLVLGYQFQAPSDKLQSVVVPLLAIIAIRASGLGVFCSGSVFLFLVIISHRFCFFLFFPVPSLLFL